MTIATECRLWGDRLADGVEAKRAMVGYWSERALWHALAHHRGHANICAKRAAKLMRQIAAAHAARKQRR